MVKNRSASRNECCKINLFLAQDMDAVGFRTNSALETPRVIISLMIRGCSMLSSPHHVVQESRKIHIRVGSVTSDGTSCSTYRPPAGLSRRFHELLVLPVLCVLSASSHASLLLISTPLAHCRLCCSVTIRRRAYR